MKEKGSITLIELMIIVAIIGILAAIAVPAMTGKNKDFEQRQAIYLKEQSEQNATLTGMSNDDIINEVAKCKSAGMNGKVFYYFESNGIASHVGCE